MTGECENCKVFCVNDGRLVGGEVVVPHKAVCPGTKIIFEATGVEHVDGEVEIRCPDGSSRRESAPAAAIVYEWDIRSPDGSRLEGEGTPAEIVAQLPGEYVCRFTAKVDAHGTECRPSKRVLPEETVRVVETEVIRIASLQHTSSQSCNYLPGGSGMGDFAPKGTPYIIVAAKSDGQLYFEADIMIEDIAGVQAIAALRRYGGLFFNGGLNPVYRILVDTPFNGQAVQAGSSKVRFVTAPFHQSELDLYEIVVGYDFNMDGILSKAEVCPSSNRYPMCFVSQSDYDAAKDRSALTTNGVFLGYDNASQFVRAFLYGQTPNRSDQGGATIRSSVAISCNDYRLEHPLGQVFVGGSGSGYAYIFPSTSALASDIAKSDALKRVLDSAIREEIANGKITASTVSHEIQIATSIDYRDEEGNVPSVDRDLHLSFGKGNIDANLALSLAPNGSGGVEVVSAKLTGEQTDLYDWNYTFGRDLLGVVGFDHSMGILQAGYPTLGSAGRTFISRVLFVETPILNLSPLTFE